MDSFIDSGIDFTVFFYNPNIHPREEYEIRKNENIRYARKKNIPFIDADYDRDQWFKRAKGLEFEPERGKRCSMCFAAAIMPACRMPPPNILRTRCIR